MKKLISFGLALVLVFTIFSTAFASEFNSEVHNSFSFYNSDGDMVTVVTSSGGNVATSKVYVNGALTQAATADAIAQTINTEIYDLKSAGEDWSQIMHYETNDFTETVTHKATSNEHIAIATSSVYDTLLDEPVEDDGLMLSGYNDGYYYLGYSGGLYYAPNVYGYLYRASSKTFDGTTKYWSWKANDTIAAISAYIALFGGPVSAIISILTFVGIYLEYNQSVELETFTFNYQYRVRVSGTIYFTTFRNITYWRIYNATTHKSTWEQKRFNDGFSPANFEMVKAGIDRYLEAQL